MKKSKLFIATLLLATSLSLSACGGNKQTSNYNPDIYHIYQLYQAEGGELTYEQWLISIKGEKGDTGAQGPKGDQGEPGQNGSNGQDGHSPVVRIGNDGYWYIDDVNTGVKAQGETGQQGEPGQNGSNGQDGRGIVSITLDYTEGNVDLYLIRYSDNTTSTFTVTNGLNGKDGEDGQDGAQGPQGIRGLPGADGHTPIVTISDDGYWIIDGNITDFIAQGPKGDTGAEGASVLTGNGMPSNSLGKDGDSYIELVSWDYWLKIDGAWFKQGNIKGGQGEQGEQGPQGPKGDTGAAGQNGVSVTSILKTASNGFVDTYTITYSNGTTSTFTVTNGINGQDGSQGEQGIQGQPGADGHTPVITISEDGYWVVDGEKTNTKAQGPKGDTGAQGPQGEKGDQGNPGQDGRSVISITNTFTDGNIDTYTITYSDGTTSTFTVTNGINGQDGSQGEQGIQGQPGADGHTPVITISEDGYWVVDGEKTNTKAQGPKGDQGEKGDTGVSIVATTIDEKGDLIVTFSDGTITNAGHVKDVDTYTVNFYVDDDLVATREVLTGQKISRPTSQETAGYSITNWYMNDLGNQVSWIFDGYFAYTVHDNVDLFAEFSYNDYTISFLDEKFNHTVSDITVTYDNPYELPVLTQTGYTFKHWVDKEGFIYDDSNPYRTSSNITLYAVWDANEYKVTLDANGALIAYSPITVVYDMTYNLPIPTRTNYIFLGWYDGETKISNSATWKFTENKSLIARWTNVTNTYVLDAGNGTCEIDSMVIGWEDEYELPTPTNPEGYLFDGWYLDGTDIPYSALNGYIAQNGTWTYSNKGGMLIAKFVDARFDYEFSSKTVKYGDTPTYEFTISKNTNAVSYELPSMYHGAVYYVLNMTDNPLIESFYVPSNCVQASFKNCTSLVSLDLSDTIIGTTNSYHDTNPLNFRGCTSLVSFDIPETFTKLPLFRGCTSLVSLVIPDNIKIRTQEDQFALAECTSLKTVVLPSTITYIPKGLFSDCTALEEVEIPEGVTTIGDQAFYRCGAYKQINLPDSVTTIGEFAFYSNRLVQYISLPKGLQTIGQYALAYTGRYISINYRGTIWEWKYNVTKGNNWNEGGSTRVNATDSYLDILN